MGPRIPQLHVNLFRVVPLLLLGAAAMAAIACSDSDTGSVSPKRGDMSLVFISHGPASDPFWSIVANGVEDAADDLGVEVDYRAPDSFDMTKMSQLIATAADERPSGLMVTIPDRAVLAGSLRAAVAADVPVLSVNAGDDAWQELGLLGHIGQTEYEAGFAAGQQLAGDGARKVLCVIHEAGNVSLDTRCRGLNDAVGRLRGSSQVLGVNPANADSARQAIVEALSADPSIDAVLALGPAGATVVADALESTGRLGSMRFGTFDLEPHSLELVREGDMLFAIDQQPYMQGYLAVTLMVKYLETGAVPGGGQIIRTGPAFVTQEDAEAVIRLAQEKLR